MRKINHGKNKKEWMKNGRKEIDRKGKGRWRKEEEWKRKGEVIGDKNGKKRKRRV